MKNRIIADVTFSFKGETHQLSLDVDLDGAMEQDGRIPNLHTKLAERHSIDPYSYEHEMMMAESIRFSDAQGIAADYLTDGAFDLEGFEAAWHQVRLMRLLAMIAESEMGIEDLEAHPALKRALVEAYLCGRESGTDQ
ncbi:MAG: hypothetical protein ABW168_22045 [Sedimenticola sp.]